MKSLLLFLVVLPGALVTFSCQPTRLVPVSYSPEQPDETISVVSDNISEIYLEYLPQKDGQIVFDLDVGNLSNKVVAVEPLGVLLLQSNNPFPQPDDSVDAIKQAVIHSGNPAAFARSKQEVHDHYRRRIQSVKIGQAAIFVLGVALAVNDAVQDSKDWNNEFFTSRDERRAVFRDISTFTGLIALDITSQGMLEDISRTITNLEYLPGEYFHDVMLAPGHRRRGKIYFDTKMKSRYYRVIFPFNGVNYLFDLRKTSL